MLSDNPFAPPENLDATELLEAWRNDGALRNAILKLGGHQDIETHHRPSRSIGLDKTAVEDFYGNDPLAQRVATKIPNEMRRGGFQLTGDGFDIKKVMKYCRKEKVLRHFQVATFYAAIYSRGAAILLQVNDAPPGEVRWDQPVDRKNIRSVGIAFAGDGYRLSPNRLSQFREKPEYFSLSAILPTELDLDGLDGGSEDAYQLFPGDRARERKAYEAELSKNLIEDGLGFIHSDRVLWFPGIWSPIDLETRYDGGISRLSLFWTHYSRYEAALISTANILHRMEVLNLKRKGLNKILSLTKAEAEAELHKQLSVLTMSLHTLGIAASDKDADEIEIIRRSLAGIPQAIKSFKEAAIAASGLTEIDLFGISTVGSGLSNNDLRDRMQRAATVESEQEAQWREPLEEYLELVFLSKEGPTRGAVPDDWAVTFSSTLVLSPTEKSQLRQQQSAVDKVYYDMGLSAKIILESRFGSGEWSAETNLPENFQVEDRNPQPAAPAEPEPEAEEDQAAAEADQEAEA